MTETMPARPLFDPAAFRLPPGIAHVCAGGEPPFLHRHSAAFERYARDKSDGSAGRTAQEATIQRVRALAAEAWGTDVGSIGLVSNVAEGVSMVMESLEWRPGDSVAVVAREYASVVAPFALQRGVRLRIAEGTAPDRLEQVVDDRTRVIAVSHVSSLTGERLDLLSLRALADRVGALLVVDHTQAAGYRPIHADLADFAFSACYKWLLGCTGTALAYWNRMRQPDWAPASAGWHSIQNSATPDYGPEMPLLPDAMRFTRGNPSHPSVYVLEEALRYLSGFDTGAIQRHVAALVQHCHAGTRALGLTPMTPAEPDRQGANLCLAHPEAGQIVARLRERGVWAWNGGGRVRFSFHGYNSAEDVHRILDALQACWPELSAAGR